MTAEKKTGAKRQAIVVLGMHRSGTSALTGVLEVLGCALPQEMMEPQPDNPKGFFESKAVARLDDEILAAAGSHWSDWKSVADWIAGEGVAGFTEQARAVLAAEFGAADLIALKDPRMCLTFPVWRAALRAEGFGVSAILTHRDPVEVARSLERRNGMPPLKALLLWLRYGLEAERATRGLTRAFTSYDRLMRDGAIEAARLAAALGLKPAGRGKDKAIGALITPELRHFGQGAGAGADPIAPHPWVTDCAALLAGWSETGETVAERRGLDRIRAAFDAAAPAFHGLIEEGDTPGAVARSAVGTARVVELERKLGQAQARADNAAEQLAAASERARVLRAKVDGEGGLGEQLRRLRDDKAALVAELAAMRAARETARQDIEAREVRLGELRGEVEIREAVLAELRNAIRQRDESLEKLRAGIEELKQRIAGLQRATDERERLLTELQARLDRSRDEAEIIRFEAETRRVEDAEQRRALTEELNAAWAAVAARLAELKAARAEHAIRLDRLTGERDALRSELARRSETLARAEARLRAMEESTSWRMTAPMRAVSGRLRRAGDGDEG